MGIFDSVTGLFAKTGNMLENASNSILNKLPGKSAETFKNKAADLTQKAVKEIGIDTKDMIAEGKELAGKIGDKLESVSGAAAKKVKEVAVDVGHATAEKAKDLSHAAVEKAKETYHDASVAIHEKMAGHEKTADATTVTPPAEATTSTTEITPATPQAPTTPETPRSDAAITSESATTETPVTPTGTATPDAPHTIA